MAVARPTRRDVTAGALAGALAGGAQAQASRPNILFILADDLGWADLSCYGRREYRTPHIDSLAARGLKLDQAYANSAICSPTRVALITGRYQYRLPIGLHEPLPTGGRGNSLPPGLPTLPLQLRRAGYATSLIGKWHLGEIARSGPLKHGYDRFFGVPDGGVDYFRHTFALTGEIRPEDGLYEGDRRIERQGYLTDLLGERAAADIATFAASGKPFFISLHFTAPHWPWEGPQDEGISKKLTDLRHWEGGSLETYAAMMKSLDDNVGKVLAALDRAGVADQTLVVFTSDNGGERFSDTWPFIGMKGELLEGGIRVPVLARWPGRIAAGSSPDQVAITMDWAPTFLAAAGVRPDPTAAPDGEDLLDVLTGRSRPRRRKLFWRFKGGDQAAVRDGDLKYLKLGGKEHLFDLAVDRRERADLKTVRAADFQRLKADWARWNAAMLPYPEDSTSNDHRTSRIADRY